MGALALDVSRVEGGVLVSNTRSVGEARAFAHQRRALPATNQGATPGRWRFVAPGVVLPAIGSDAFDGVLLHDDDTDVFTASQTANMEAHADLILELIRTRQDNGQSVEDVAALLGCEPASLRDAETGDRVLNLSELSQMASALGVVVRFRLDRA